MNKVIFYVNEMKYEATVKPYNTLYEILKDELGFIEVKHSCNKGECGACTVLMDGKSIVSCLTPAIQVNGRKITTIKGITQNALMHPLQQKLIEHGAVQCGYCMPGMILSVKALLDENLHPTEEEVRIGISGNICRCTGYQQIVEAIMDSAKEKFNM